MRDLSGLFVYAAYIFQGSSSLMLKRTLTSVVIMAVMISLERMTLVVPQARARCSACNGKLWPRAEPLSVVSEECRCHMHCLSYMMHLLLVGTLKKEKQQLDMNVCVQTNESKGRYVCGKMTGGGEISPLLFLSGLTPRLSPAVRGRHTQMGCSLSLSPSITLSLAFPPRSVHMNSVVLNSQ